MVPFFKRFKLFIQKQKKLKKIPTLRRPIIWVSVRTSKFGDIICSDLLYGWSSTSSFNLMDASTLRDAQKSELPDLPLCSICYTDPLWSDIPSIKLKSCDHCFHLHCVKTMLMTGYNGARISFKFRGCPLCKEPMKHPKVDHLNQGIDKIYNKLAEKVLSRLKYEKLDQHPAILDKDGKYYAKPVMFGMDRYAYYLCSKCNSPYFVGLNRCLAAGDNPDDSLDKNHFVCLKCADHEHEEHKQSCDKHGTDYIEWKCKFCCSISTFQCGSTHFCELCHHKAGPRWNSENDGTLEKHCPLLPNLKTYELEKLDIDECPLGIKHPPHGTEYCLGCGLCRAEQALLVNQQMG